MIESIINKYRPRNFDEVIGHADVIAGLQAVIKKQVAAAFLFSGPPGIGKTTLARITAQAYGCSEQATIEVDGASETGIDNIRELTAELMYRPLGEGVLRRAVIIDEAHALSPAANKALLKSLEEPPDHVVWFLCTTLPAKLDRAIVTRCLHYPLKELHEDDLLFLLACTDEGDGMDKGIRALCAEEAEGSPRQALTNLGVCLGCKTREEAARLLRSASEAPQAVDLARELLRGTSWFKVQQLLTDLKGTNPESIRHVVRAYATKVALNAQEDSPPCQALAVLEAFEHPFHSADGITPVVLACARLIIKQ